MNDTAASAAAQEAHDQARLLAEALPFMQRYENKTIVVKYGGARHGQSGARPGLCARHRAAEAVRREPDRGAWRRAADRPDARQRWASRASSRAACASPTRRRSRSSRWFWPAPSTRRSSRSSTRRASGRSGSRGKDGNMVFAEKAREDRRRPRFQHRAGARPRLRRRAGRGRPHAARPSGPLGDDPGARAGRARGATARPTTSTPTRLPAPSPARCRRRACSSSPTCRACSTSRAS